MGVKGKLGIGFAAVVFVALAASAGHAREAPGGLPGGPPGGSVGETYEIARLTGQESINRTGERWNIYGTDLGSMFEHKGRLHMAFGDTFGAPGQPPAFGEDWRSNTLAFSRDRSPEDGITFDGMVTDRPGHAKELITDEQVPGEEVTIIPTYGASTGKDMVLHYMAVREWDVEGPGTWDLNQSGLAYSEDDGQTWKLSEVVWPGDSNFGQVAFVEEGRHLYLFGIPGGRFGGVEMARVERRDALDKGSYEYWDGRRWQKDEGAAATIVDGPVGELSVRWNSHYGKWIMMYLNEDKAAVVLRTADCMAGPWDAQREVVGAEEVPSLYAPYMPPRWNDGKEIYFALSRFDEYDVYWWRTALPEKPGGKGPKHGGKGQAKCAAP